MLNCSFKKLQISEDYINIYKHIFNEWKCVCVCVFVAARDAPSPSLSSIFNFKSSFSSFKSDRFHRMELFLSNCSLFH